MTKDQPAADPALGGTAAEVDAASDVQSDAVSDVESDAVARGGLGARAVRLIPPDYRTRLRRHLWPLVVLWVVAVAVVAGFMVSSRAISPIDEAAHLDYILRMPESFPSSGQRMLPETRQIWSCRGTELDMDLPACSMTPGAPIAYPGAAYGLAGSHPPLYYLVTDVVGNVVEFVTPLDTLDSYRSVGILWLGLALSTTYLLAIALRAQRSAALGVTLMVASTAAVAWQSGALGNDTASWFTGNLILLAAVRYRREWRSVLALVIAALIVAATKQTGFLAVGAAAVAILLQAPLRRPGDERRLHGWWKDWLVAIAIVVVFAVPSLAWTWYANSQAVGDPGIIPQNQRFLVEGGWPWESIMLQSLSFLTPIADTAPGAFLDSRVQNYLQPAVGGLLMMGCLAALCVGRARPRLVALGIGTVVLLLLGGPLLATANYALSESFFELSRRYAFALLGAMVALAAASLESGAWRRAVLVAGIGLMVISQLQTHWLAVL